MSALNNPLDRGRAAYDLHGWSDAFDLLAAADREESLEPTALERLTIAAYLLGREDEHFRPRERLHLELLDRWLSCRRGQPLMCALSLDHGLRPGAP